MALPGKFIKIKGLKVVYSLFLRLFFIFPGGLAPPPPPLQHFLAPAGNTPPTKSDFVNLFYACSYRCTAVLTEVGNSEALLVENKEMRNSNQNMKYSQHDQKQTQIF